MGPRTDGNSVEAAQPGPEKHSRLVAVLGVASPLVAAALTTLLVLVRTARFGPELTPDSVDYISIARNVAASGAYVTYRATPAAEWPPLFPGLLALLQRLGWDVLGGGRWLYAGLAGRGVFPGWG